MGIYNVSLIIDILISVYIILQNLVISFLSEHVWRPWKLIKRSDTWGIKLIPARCMRSPRENQPLRLIDTNWHQFPSICDFYEGTRNFRDARRHLSTVATRFFDDFSQRAVTYTIDNWQLSVSSERCHFEMCR